MSSSRFARGSVNAEAYDAYLFGPLLLDQSRRPAQEHRGLPAGNRKKIPQYALAYAGLAGSYALLGQVPYDDMSPLEAKPRARAAARARATAGPLLLGEAHAVLANIAFSYDWNFAAAEQEFQRALALSPNNPTPHLWFSHYCIVRNRLPQALEEKLSPA